jgi:purine-binding chemotaxis protein CheW
MDQFAVPAQPAEGRQERAIRVCLLQVAGEHLAVDLRHVQEVFEVEGVTPVPGMPPALVGVTNLRGLVMPVVDLRRVVGLPTSGPPPRFAVVLRHGDQHAAVLADELPELRHARPEDLLPAPSRDAGAPRTFLCALLRTDERMSGVVAVPDLLASVGRREAS